MKSQAKKAKEDEEGLSFTLRSFLDNLRTISLHYYRLPTNRAGERFKDSWEVYTRWLAHARKEYENEVLAGNRRESKLPGNRLWEAKDIDEFWAVADPYNGLNLLWPFHFGDKAFRRFTTMPIPTREGIMSWLLELAKGAPLQWEKLTILQEGPCKHMVAFSAIVTGGTNVLFLIQMHRIPEIRQSTVTRFEFFQHIHIVDFARQETKMTGTLEQYLSTIVKEEEKWLRPEGTIEELKEAGFVTFADSVRKVGRRYAPIGLAPQLISSKDAQKIVKIGNRWISSTRSDSPPKSETAVETYLTQLNSEALAQLADAESCKGFIRLLETIPNFRIRLTDQERELIGTPGSVLAIGRSGTGKTTCALLRLFASEVLYKYRSQHAKAGSIGLVSTKFEAEDLDSRCGLHTVFVTASPVLTNEVRRFYWRLNEHIREELKRRNEMKRKRKEEQNQEYDIIEDNEGELELRRQASSEKEEIKLQAEEDQTDPAEEEASANTQHSLAFLHDEDFPLFATVRRLVLMVDATLRNPFFSRNANGAIIGMNEGSQWHNELKGVLMINREYKKKVEGQENADSSGSSSESEEEPAQDQESAPKASTRLGKKLSFEVDYEYFLRYFYPKVAQRSACGPLTLWTEIVAYIKGSAESHKHPGWYLSRGTYATLGRKTSFLKAEDKYSVWDLFIEYEKWKLNLGAYDFQDVVNHQLYFLHLHGYLGVPIHYMMIDEVQDLTHATLLLLGKITEQSLFFSGDTAQTIAKGVGFRFCDLRSLFYKDSGLNMPEPSVRQLTVNFRSHGRILDLANSVVSLLEAMFPRTIDKMAKEKSTVDGPKPMILASQSVEELFILLFGAHRVQPSSSNLLSRAPIEFGCDQVIIVRNQEEKGRLPAVLKGALCLTVYESKGLEFDDVVLFDFFAQSEVPEAQWRILEQLTIVEHKSEEVPTDFDALETSPLSVRLNNPHFEDIKYSLLCTELKMLYVAITRPRKRLIVFDSHFQIRDYVLQYWRQLGVVDELQVQTGAQSLAIVNTSSGEQVVESIAEGSGAEAWRAQGLKMMRFRFYDQALKCFEYAGDQALQERAQCYSLANEAAEAIAKTQEMLEMKKFQRETLLKAEKKQIKQTKSESYEKFLQAGERFKRLGLLKQAARCFFSAQSNQEAALLFEACEAWGQCAEALCACEDWTRAGAMFSKAGDYARAIDAYRKAKAWDEVLECIHKFGDVMTLKEKEALIKKYIPIALEDLMPKIVNMGEEDRVYLKEETEEVKKPIPEEDSDEEDEAIEGTEGKQAEERQTEEIKAADSSLLSISSSVEASSLLISAQPLVQSTNPFSMSSNPFAPAESGPADIQSVESDRASSYSIISAESKSASGSVVDENYRLEALSQYDPDDEWLQVDKGSVADSIQSAVHKDGSVSFDYSIFDNSQAVALNLGGQLIQTKAEIFVEDEIMKRIIQYISMFSKEVRSYLLSLRSADILVMTGSLQTDWRAASMIDLDEVDVKLICTVLDTLEYFQLYKLCLVVCNRYALADRLGRYVTSLAHKYASLPETTALTNEKAMLFQKEKSVLAYTALHNVFEMINPEVLAPKPPKDPKSLGLHCFQSLLLLGYWKKCVYLLDRDNALAITATFADFRNYKVVYTQGSQETACFKWLQTGEDWEAAIVSIDEATYVLNQRYSVTLKSTRKEDLSDFPSFPPWSEFTASIWGYLRGRTADTTANLKRHLVAACYVLPTYFRSLSMSASAQVRIHDCCSFLALVLFASRTVPPVKELLDSMSVEHFEMLLQAVNVCENVLAMGSNEVGFSKYHMDMVVGLLAPLGVREIRDCEVNQCLPLSSHVVVSRNSVLPVPVGDKIVPIDMEGDFYLCPLDVISKAAAYHLVRIIADSVNSRYRHWTSTQGNSLNFDSIETLSPVETRLKVAACLFGEFAYTSSLQLRYPSKFPNYLRGLKQDDCATGEDTELEELQRDLGKILALGAEDRAAMKFVRSANGGTIENLEKRIADLKRKRAEAGDVSRFRILFESVVKDMEWVFTTPPCITSIAKNYLLVYTQNLVKSIRYDLPADHTLKMMSASRVYLLCRSELLLLDLIRVKAHPALVTTTALAVATGVKQAKVTNRYLEDLAWVDVQVYCRHGDWAEAGRTLLSYLECEFGSLDVERKVALVEKAIVLGVIAGTERPFLPDYYLQRVSKGEKPYRLNGKVCRSDSGLLLASALAWLTTLSPDLAQAYSLKDDPLAQHITKAALTLTATALVNSQEPHPKLLTAFDTLRNTLERHMGSNTDSFVKRLLSVKKTKDIGTLRKEMNTMHSRYLYGTFGELICEETVSKVELEAALDRALLLEAREKSHMVTLNTKIVTLALRRKKRCGKLRLKLPPQVLNPLERASLTRLCRLLPSVSASKQVFIYWRSNRALMRLYPTIFNYYWGYLLYNQTATFTNVLDRHHVLNQIFNAAETYTSFQAELSRSLGTEGNVAEFVSATEEELNSRIKAFYDWIHAVSANKKLDLTSKNKRKWDAQWKARLTKNADTGKKKQKYLEYRAKLLKRTGRS